MKAILERLLLMSLSLVVLLVAEGGLRLVGYGSSEYGALDFGIGSEDRLYGGDPAKPGYMKVEQWVFDMGRAAHRLLINDDTFPKARPAGQLRIIATGESAVFGYPTGGALAFPHRLGVLIGERHPELGVRVINAGVPGYDARRSLKVVEEVLDYQPSVVILYTGHNEYLRRFTMENLQDLGMTVRVRQQLYKLRLYQLLLNVLRPLTGHGVIGKIQVEEKTREMEKREGFGQPRTSFETKLIVDRYRQNIQLAIDAANRAHVKLVLCTVVSNVKAYPKHTVYDADVTEAQMKKAEEIRWQIKNATKDEHDLERLAREALAIVPGHAQFHHVLAEALEKQGRLDEALAEYIDARELEATQRRGGIAFNTAIRELGARGGATVVDLENIFLVDMEHGHWGEELFSDYCHPNEQGRDVIAEAIYRAVDWTRLPR